jgi:hypothetical protein
MGGAHNLNGGDQTTVGMSVVNKNLAFVEVEQVGSNDKRRLGRSPDCRRDSTIGLFLEALRSSWIVFLGGPDVDFDRGAKVDVRGSGVMSRESLG